MLKVLELFAGIGACSKALERLGIEHEIVDAVEIDKYAITSFNAIHRTNFDVQDITIWDKDIDVDLIMQGSPCQDFSVAGKQAGGDVGSGTRSSLMYETIRIVGKLRPKFVVWENVKNLLSKKHKHNFDAYIETMNILGYNSYYQVLNAKDYGIPQNRERVFTISIRKDIDKGTFTFPKKETLELRLKDMLEEQVDEKYYLSDKMMNYVLKPGTKGYMKEPKCEQVGTLDIKGQDCIKRVYSDEGLSPTLTNMQGGNRQPKILEDFYKNRPVREYEEVAPTLRSERIGLKVVEPQDSILVKNATKKGYDEAIDGDSVNLSYPESTTRRGRVGHGLAQTLQCNDSMGVVEAEIKVLGNYMPSNHDASRIVDSDGLAPTVKENYGTVTATNTGLRIRKLTPCECWRLMGFDDEDFEKARNALNEKFYKGKDKSSSQLYKQAGNSIVVNVLEKIFKNLLEE